MAGDGQIVSVLAARRSFPPGGLITLGLQGYNVMAAPYNAKGDGVLKSDAARVQAAVNDAIADGGGIVILPPGRDFRLEASVIIQNAVDLWIVAYGATIHLDAAAQAAWRFQGGTGNLRVRILGGRIIGTAQSGDAQIGVGTTTGGLDAAGDDILVDGVSVEDTTIGVRFDYGALDGWTNVRIHRCYVKNIVGVVAGTGYGLALSATRGGEVWGCYAERVQRHSIYISASEEINVEANRIFRHRYQIGVAGDRLAGIVLARSSRVAATHNRISESWSTAASIEPRELSVGADREIQYTHNFHRDNLVEEIWVGTQSPATDNELSDVSVEENDIYHATTPADGTIPVRIFAGKRIRFCRNRVYMDSQYTTQVPVVYLPATGGAGFTDDIYIDGNDGILTTAGGGVGAVVEIGGALCGGTQIVRVRNNDLRVSGAGANRNVLYDGAVTNPNLIVRDPAGWERRFIDRGDTGVILSVGVDTPQQLFASALTANRTITLSTLGANPGDEFLVTRTGLGAFTLDVGGLKTIPAGTAAAVRVRFDGAAWKLVQYGTL